MKRTHGLLALAAFVSTGLVIWWVAGPAPPVPEHTPAAQGSDVVQEELVTIAGVASDETRPEVASFDAESQVRAVAPVFRATQRSSETIDVPAVPELPRGISWPVKRSRRTAGGGGAAAAEPVVPVRLAFRALWYLGVDPEAERTWSRAINDPNSPAGVRSDLIEDMIDEGYTDNNNPTVEDLPVILARLEIIERYAPFAMDQINANAFEETYADLLELYIRLGGEPWDGW